MINMHSMFISCWLANLLNLKKNFCVKISNQSPIVFFFLSQSHFTSVFPFIKVKEKERPKVSSSRFYGPGARSTFHYTVQRWLMQAK